jgi:sulfoxide reductase catalytic subunit YedY
MSKNRVRLPKIEPTPESTYINRRQVIAQMGLGAIIAAASPLIGASACRAQAAGPSSAVPPEQEKHPALRPGIAREDILKLYPPRRNAKYALPGNTKVLTDPLTAVRYNNFYEFTTQKDLVWRLAQRFNPDPWTIEVTGLCHKPTTFSIDDIYKKFGADLEERTYRFRCVEAWAMDVPWIGIELNKLLKAVEPKSDAKYISYYTAERRREMPGIVTQPWYEWPYYEGLRMDEAMNELTLLATGIYGRPLPRQMGAPFRVLVPWKYGYKSGKSIVKIELVAEKPTTFWEKQQPDEYPFESNVDPTKPHPRWSQATERLINDQSFRRTLPFNGYGEYVGKLYG